MSVLTRKILPPVFGIATIGWIIGGTIWFDNQLTNSNTIASSKALTLSSSTAVAQDGILPIQALNLFFKKDKFQFAENAELQAYFNDLTTFLQHNPTAKLKIAAYRSNTEGGKTSTNRLAFIADFLKNKRLDSRQFIFEDNKKTTLLTAAVADAENLKNQRLEIRIMTP